MIKEYDIVKARIDLTDKIKKDTTGTVLSVYDNGKNFLVEFFDENKETIDDGMTLVKLADIELVYYYPNNSNQ